MHVQCTQKTDNNNNNNSDFVTVFIYLVPKLSRDFLFLSIVVTTQ